MSDPVFATLADVPLREAWAHEAHRFTPWLAANLAGLSAVIGIPLELTGTEMRVGTFSGDILARSAINDSVVLIENQLEGSDHTQLGQITTYLAGLDAQTMVWVGDDAFNVFRSLLVDPADFRSMSIEAAFAPLAGWPEADWYPWLQDRYASLCLTEETT